MVCFGMNFLRWMFRAGVIGMAIVNPLPPCFGGRHSTVNGSDKSVQNGSIYLPNVTTLIKKGLGMKNRLWQMIELYLINLLEGNSITKSNFFQITKYKVVTALGSDHTCLCCRWQVRHDSFVKSHLLWLKCGNSLPTIHWYRKSKTLALIAKSIFSHEFNETWWSRKWFLLHLSGSG